jgi:hypothetical protein
MDQKPMLRRRFVIRSAVVLGLLAISGASVVVATRRGWIRWPVRLPPVRRDSVIDLVYLGGPDCPYCVAWKAGDLPRLKAMPIYREIRFTEVLKRIADPVPPPEGLPSHLSPMRDEIARVVNRTGGSPMFALLVDGKGVMGGFGTRPYHEMIPVIETLLEKRRQA